MTVEEAKQQVQDRMSSDITAIRQPEAGDQLAALVADVLGVGDDEAERALEAAAGWIERVNRLAATNPLSGQTYMAFALVEAMLTGALVAREAVRVGGS